MNLSYHFLPIFRRLVKSKNDIFTKLCEKMDVKIKLRGEIFTMKKIWLKCVALGLIAILAVGLTGCGSKNFPNKNISTIIMYSAGGPTDMSIRGLLDVAGKELPKGISFVPVNRTGAGGIIGITEAAKSKADGYTLGVINSDFIMHHYFGETDLTPDDFVPFAIAMADPFTLVVNADAPYQTLNEFIEYAKANPGKVTVGNSGAGGAPHLAAIAFQKEFGIEFNNVTYDGATECVAAVAGGHLDATFIQPSPAKSQVEAGKLTMLGVMSNERMKSFPDVPTVKEAVDANLIMRVWVAIAAPKGIPEDVETYFKNIFEDAITKPEYQNIIESLGMEPTVIIGDDMMKMINDDMVYYKDLCSQIELSK